MPTSIKQMTFTVTDANPSALQAATTELTLGGSALFTGTAGLTAANTDSGNMLVWQTRGFYDEVRRKIYFMGKAAQNQAKDGRLFIYDEVSNTWTDYFPPFLEGDTAIGGHAGHIYETHTYDYDAGDQYFLQYGTREMRYLAQGADPVNGWDEDHASLYTFATTFNGGTGETGAVWHPNLYGPGDGGVINVSGIGLMAWRKSTDTWANIQSYSLGGATMNHAGACYSRGMDAAICSLGTDLRCFRVTPGPVVTQIQNTPVLFSFDRGSLADDPNETATMYCLERNGFRVWKYSASGGGTWALQSFTHPFASAVSGGSTAGWDVVTLYGMNAFLGIERNGSTSIRTRVWRPNS